VQIELQERRQGRRTTLWEDDLHVGTIVELARPARRRRGTYAWYVAHSGGFTGSDIEARMAIERELAR